VKLLQAGLRLFFVHFYTSLAWTYDAIAYLVSVGQWNAWVLSAQEAITADPVLEIGHGPGHLLVKLGPRATGLDPSRQMSRLARRRLRRSGIKPRLVRARSQALPFRSASFGCLVATFPAEYILEPRSIEEAWRVLRAGAELVIVAMAEIRGRGALDRLANWLFRVTGQAGEFPPEWTEPLVQVGFEVHRVDLPVLRSNVVQIIGSKPPQPRVGPRDLVPIQMT
jgi:ubiquinone/menaquinone biosynthesis C-methylase UbiE